MNSHDPSGRTLAEANPGPWPAQEPRTTITAAITIRGTVQDAELLISELALDERIITLETSVPA